MEHLRLRFTDPKYERMFRKFWDEGLPKVKNTAEVRRKRAERKAELLRELQEYTESDAFDPVKAKQLRRKLRKSIKENLEKFGNWREGAKVFWKK